MDIRCCESFSSRNTGPLFCDSQRATCTLLLYTQQASDVVTHTTDNWLKSLSARWLSWLRFQWNFSVVSRKPVQSHKNCKTPNFYSGISFKLLLSYRLFADACQFYLVSPVDAGSLPKDAKTVSLW